MKKENQLKALTDLGSPPGMLTEEKLHEFFKEFRLELDRTYISAH
jgi:hypothetical protein